MKISVIVPVLNEAERIALTLRRLQPLEVDEVVFVDGGSTDGTRDQILAAGMKLIQSSPGRGPQLRLGAASAQGDLLLFLHADNGLHPAGIGQLRKAAATRARLWGGFEQRIEDEAWKYRWLECGNAWRARWRGLIYGDQGLFVGRDLYDQVGGMPDLPLMEDFEFSRRLNRLVRPILLPGPHFVSPRRWQRQGVLRQTLINWSLVVRYRLGQSPQLLNQLYRRHDST